MTTQSAVTDPLIVGPAPRTRCADTRPGRVTAVRRAAPAGFLRTIAGALEAVLLPELSRYERSGELDALGAATRRDIGYD